MSVFMYDQQLELLPVFSGWHYGTARAPRLLRAPAADCFGPNLPLLFKVHKIRSVDSKENCCHQMSDFKAIMHQIRFRLGFCPRPRWWNLQRSLRPSSWI